MKGGALLLLFVLANFLGFIYWVIKLLGEQGLPSFADLFETLFDAICAFPGALVQLFADGVSFILFLGLLGLFVGVIKLIFEWFSSRFTKDE
jgi:hypothetical protein